MWRGFPHPLVDGNRHPKTREDRTMFTWEELSSLNAMIAEKDDKNLRSLSVKVGMMLVTSQNGTKRPKPEKVLKDFPSRLRALRHRLQLSQTDVAKKIGVSKNAVYQYESGESFPTLLNVLKLCETLGTEPSYLLGWTSKGAASVGEAVKALQEALE